MSSVLAKDNKVLACSSTLWVPYNWETAATVEGAGITIARQFFMTQGVELELIVLGSWARCLKYVEIGTIDIAIAAYKTPERTAFGRYVEEAFGIDALRIYANQNKPVIFDKIEELSAFRGGGVRGDSYGEQFDIFKKTLSYLQWSEVNQAEQNVKKLIQGRLDYTLMTPWTMKVLLLQLTKEKLLPQETKIIATGKPVNQNGLHFLFSKKSNKYKDFGKRMSLFIKELKTSGKMEQIINDSFEAYTSQQNIKASH